MCAVVCGSSECMSRARLHAGTNTIKRRLECDAGASNVTEKVSMNATTRHVCIAFSLSHIASRPPKFHS